MKQPVEIRPIPGHPGYYVSNEGDVWGVQSSIFPLAQSVNGKWGYLKVKLSGGKTFKVHNLVALAFLGPRDPGDQVNHKDGDKANNNVSNLEYVTASENVRHAYAMGLIPTRPKRERVTKPRAPRSNGEQVKGHKLTEQDVVEIRRLRDVVGLSYREIARRFGIAQPVAWRIATRRDWRHVA